ncbi:katanin p60 ATPase-containing subunit, partial [Trifolium medium]|nr:katanin p60 ATPase-containing subunit [Trifolium medium]
MASGAKLYLLLKTTSLQKLGSGLINQFQMAMILEAISKMIMANHLQRIESSGGDDDKVAINEIFEVASNQCKSGALVLFIKDIEKAMVGNTDVLKSKFETLPQNIVVIGSNTQLDSRKEK